MIVEILFVVFMAIWFLTCLPMPQLTQFSWANSLLAFICVLLLGIFLFLPALRG